ncbi:MAG: phosphatidate cytidylyltransferase [Xanthomonadales bacterium]|nr:phosphatidate cytidylyltransferase [Xanthomonadales bacterium]
MKQRIITSLILAPIAIAFILLSSTPLFAGLLALVWAAAMWEWTRLIGMQQHLARASAVVLTLLMMAGLWLLRGQPAWWLCIVIGVAWWLVALWWMRGFSFAASPNPRNVAIKLVAGWLVLVPSWTALVQIHDAPGVGGVWALYALFVVWAADTFAYVFGSRWGRNKLAPRISPGKTLEGVWGALLGSGLIALIGGWWIGARGVALALLVVLGLLCVVWSILGDLFESLMKRQANVKDSGALFPGHGGLLDRLDGVFAAMPMFALGKLLIDLFVPA